jgi:hypothetical protein
MTTASIVIFINLVISTPLTEMPERRPVNTTLNDDKTSREASNAENSRVTFGQELRGKTFMKTESPTRFTGNFRPNRCRAKNEAIEVAKVYLE